MNLTTSYQYLGSSPEDGPTIKSVVNSSGTRTYYSKFYVQAKIKSYNASDATLTARVLIRNTWMGWRTTSVVIALTGASTHTFVNSGSSTWEGAYANGTGSGSYDYATVWTSSEFDFNVSYGTFNLGAKISGDGINTCSPSASCTVIKPTITISYDANGGTGAPPNQTPDRNSTTTLSTVVPTKEPSIVATNTVTFYINGSGGQLIGDNTAVSRGIATYDFKEWYTTQSGTGGTAYPAGGSITVGTSDIILYAQWTPNQATYNSITMPSAIRPGYSLLGWSTSSSAQTPDAGKTPGAQWIPSSTTSLYAVWKVQNVSLRLCQEIFDLIYPIGSIYITMADSNPSALFGGTWNRVGVGRTLISAGGGTNPIGDANTVSTWGSWDGTGQTSLFPAGEKGGETTHTLSESELPIVDSGLLNWHGQEHGTHVYRFSDSAYGSPKWYGTLKNNMYQTTGQTTGAYSYAELGFRFGGGGSHGNVEPYLAVYMWQRVA